MQWLDSGGDKWAVIEYYLRQSCDDETEPSSTAHYKDEMWIEPAFPFPTPCSAFSETFVDTKREQDQWRVEALVTNEAARIQYFLKAND